MEQSVITVFESANWILGFLGIYVAIILYLGFRYSGRIEESDDLALAGRNLTLPFLVPSIVATWICAGAIMGAAAEAYLWGFQGVIWDPFGPVLMMFIVAIFFAYRLRQSRFSTVVDFMSTRYNERVGEHYLFIQVLSATSWLGGQLVALGIIVNLTTGVGMAAATIIATAVVILVTYFGGLWALSRVDVIGFILIIVGLFIMFPIVIGEVGGWEYFVNNAANWGELPTFAIFPVAAEDGGFIWYTGLLGIMYYLSAWASLGIGDINSQVLLQRVLAAKDEKTAVRGFMISGVAYLVLGMIPVLMGIAMFTYGLELPIEQTEYVLPWVAENFLPNWAGVLFIVALTAAIISTVGDNCLIVSTMIGHNLYPKFVKGATPRQKLKAMRVAIPVVALVAMGIALMFTTVYKLIVFTGAISLVTIIMPYVFGFFWKKANTKGALASFYTGAVTTAISFLLIFPYTQDANMDILVEGEVYMDWAIWDALYMALIPGALLGLIAMVVVSLATQKSDPPKPFINAKGESMDSKKIFFWQN
jgi:solute:Na+ symporter, SSS family